MIRESALAIGVGRNRLCCVRIRQPHRPAYGRPRAPANKFIKPDLRTGTNPLPSLKLPNLRGWLPDPPGEDDYPIVTYTWLLCRRKYPPRLAQVLKSVISFGLSQEQYSAALGYLPLPADVVRALTKPSVKSHKRLGPSSECGICQSRAAQSRTLLWPMHTGSAPTLRFEAQTLPGVVATVTCLSQSSYLRAGATALGSWYSHRKGQARGAPISGLCAMSPITLWRHCTVAPQPGHAPEKCKREYRERAFLRLQLQPRRRNAHNRLT